MYAKFTRFEVDQQKPMQFKVEQKEIMQNFYFNISVVALFLTVSQGHQN